MPALVEEAWRLTICAPCAKPCEEVETGRCGTSKGLVGAKGSRKLVQAKGLPLGGSGKYVTPLLVPQLGLGIARGLQVVSRLASCRAFVFAYLLEPPLFSLPAPSAVPAFISLPRVMLILDEDNVPCTVDSV